MHDPQLVHVIHDQHHCPEVICTCGAHLTLKAKYAHTTMALSTNYLPAEGAESSSTQGYPSLSNLYTCAWQYQGH